jgi:hypothetical protein
VPAASPGRGPPPSLSGAAAAAGDDGAAAGGAGGGGGFVSNERASCDSHVVTATATLGPERNLSAMWRLPPRGDAELTRMTVNSFDIGDLGYVGSAEVIGYLGARMWRLCAARARSSGPQFAGRVQDAEPAIDFSEYNLMMWRALLDAGWDVDSLFMALRISRALVSGPAGGIKPRRRGS